MQKERLEQKVRPVRRRRRVNERGIELAEAAMTLPLVLAMIVGIIEGGRLILAYSIVAHVAREATRYAIVRGSASEGQIATASDVVTYAKSRSGVNPVTVTTTWLPDNKPGSVVQVKVQHIYQPILPVLPTKTLSSTSKMTIN